MSPSHPEPHNPRPKTPRPGPSAAGRDLNTARQQYFDANEVAIGVFSTLIQAKEDGLISQEDWDEKVNPGIQEANSALDEYKQALDQAELTGNYDPLVPLRTTLMGLLARLNDYL